jgi:hypothetical protein
MTLSRSRSVVEWAAEDEARQPVKPMISATRVVSVRMEPQDFEGSITALKMYGATDGVESVARADGAAG